MTQRIQGDHMVLVWDGDVLEVFGTKQVPSLRFLGVYTKVTRAKGRILVEHRSPLPGPARVVVEVPDEAQAELDSLLNALAAAGAEVG
ncbi:MAG TPA: hypothetical protein VKE97_09890 [Acidimicrobiia bacterium]|nr:hypothetical protein [Acidimicrobiia bacterium]